MANRSKGVVSPSGELTKHLKKFGKRKFWKAERKAINKALEEVKR